MVLIYKVCTMKKFCLYSLKLDGWKCMNWHKISIYFLLFLNPLARRIWTWVLLVTGDHSLSYCLFVRIFYCIKITGFNYKLKAEEKEMMELWNCTHIFIYKCTLDLSVTYKDLHFCILSHSAVHSWSAVW